jgi:hypothetical protein
LYEFLSDFGISCSMYLQFTLSLNDDGIFWIYSCDFIKFLWNSFYLSM